MIARDLTIGTIGGLVLGWVVTMSVADAQTPSWSGFYAGLNAGGMFGTGDGTGNRFAGNDWSAREYNGNGMAGGAQIGYNFQLSPLFILGIENDLSFTGEDSRKGGRTRPETTVPWFGSGRLRAGVTPSGLDTLFYGTTGLAFGQVGNGVDTKLRTGWTLGGGAEWAFLPSWSVRGEYLYSDLAWSLKKDNWGSTEAQFHTVRLGLNYHF